MGPSGLEINLWTSFGSESLRNPQNWDDFLWFVGCAWISSVFLIMDAIVGLRIFVFPMLDCWMCWFHRSGARWSCTPFFYAAMRWVMWCDLTWCEASRDLSLLVLVCWVGTCLIYAISCNVVWCDAMWGDSIWCDATPFDATWCEMAWLDVMWRDVMTYEGVRCQMLKSNAVP